MVFWMAGEVDADAYDVFHPLSRWVEDAVNALLRISDYGADIDKWAFVAMINAPSEFGRPELAKFHKRRGVAEFCIRIPKADFIEGTEHHRRELVIDALVRSLAMMPQIGVKTIDVERLSADVKTLLQTS
jgi:hypothetical protein